MEFNVIGKEGREDIFVLPAGTFLKLKGYPVKLRSDTEFLGNTKLLNELIEAPCVGEKEIKDFSSASQCSPEENLMSKPQEWKQ